MTTGFFVALPDMIRMIEGVPPDVVEASRQLACSTCVLVNVWHQTGRIVSRHMTYFYDEDICFTRLGFPHMLSHETLLPAQEVSGGGLLLRQVTNHSPDRRKTGLIRLSAIFGMRVAARGRSDPVTEGDVPALRNIIFDLERAKALKTVTATSMISVFPIVDDTRLGIHVDGRELHQREKAADRALSAAISFEVVRYR